MAMHDAKENEIRTLDDFERDAELFINLKRLVSEHNRLKVLFNEVTGDEVTSVIYKMIAVEEQIRDIGSHIHPRTMRENVVRSVSPILFDKHDGRITWLDKVIRFFCVTPRV